MNHIKTFNEMRKATDHFGVELGQKQINYIFDGIDRQHLNQFEILVDDNIYYVKYSDRLWEFDRIQDLRDFIHFIYYIDRNSPYKVLEIIKRNKRLDYTLLNNWPIRWASYQGHDEVVKLFLQDPRVDPSDNNNYAIRWASVNGHTEVVKLLLQDDRVDPSAWDNYAIRYASKNRQTKIVKLLIQHPKVREKLKRKMGI